MEGRRTDWDNKEIGTQGYLASAPGSNAKVAIEIFKRHSIFVQENEGCK